MNPKLSFIKNSKLDTHLRWVFGEFKKKLIPYEVVFNPATDTQRFYPIPGFNGYEMSDWGVVRSMKHFNKYPFGIIIRYDDKYRYNISTNNNDRVEISMEELWKITTNGDTNARLSTARDIGARNQRLFLQTDDTLSKAKCKIKKKHVPTNKKEDTFFPKFTIIADDEEGISPLEFYN